MSGQGARCGAVHAETGNPERGSRVAIADVILLGALVIKVMWKT